MNRTTEQIRRMATKKHPFWALVAAGQNDACWPWLGNKDRHGYGYQGRERAHRIAWSLSRRVELETGAVVMHSCDRPDCCNPLHLALGSQLENIQDRVQKSRSARGELNGRASMTGDIAMTIRSAEGSYSELAARFGVSKEAVRGIKSGRTWGWLAELNIPTVPTNAGIPVGTVADCASSACDNLHIKSTT